MRRSVLTILAVGTLLALAPPAVADDRTAGHATALRGTAAAVDLGSLGTGPTVPHAVNAKGQVVGISDFRAFVWSDGLMTDLEARTGRPFLTPTDINDRGQIAGYYYSEDDGLDHAVLIQGARVTELGEGRALLVNERGVVAGIGEQAFGSGRPFLWQRGVRTDLDPGAVPGRPVSVSRVVDLDDHGTLLAQVTGPDGEFEEPGHHQGYVWTRGAVTLLADPDVRVAVPSDLDERGRVVGTSYPPGLPGSSEAFLWEDGELVLLQEPEPGCFRIGLRIDDHGRVLVETTCPVAGVGPATYALWDDGGVLDLVPPRDAVLRGPTMSTRGLVAGVLTRAGEPATIGAYQDGRWTELDLASTDRAGVVAVSSRGHVLLSVGEPGLSGRALLWTVRPRS
ncbi:hypothetical protein ACWFNE_11475 [Cellulomonas sp. NPDC055163]